MYTTINDIILVDDNKSDALLTIRTLKKHNPANSLIHLFDGAQALDYVFETGGFEGRNIEEKPRVIFLDIKMLKVSGLEVHFQS